MDTEPLNHKENHLQLNALHTVPLQGSHDTNLLTCLANATQGVIPACVFTFQMFSKNEPS